MVPGKGAEAMSQRDSGYTRKHLDRYETPAWVTRALIPHIPERVQRIWEPACGSGKMSKVLFSDRFGGWATDIETGDDFLDPSMQRYDMDAIITNPPYAHAQDFIEKALQMTSLPVKGVVAMLLRTDFDHAKGRQALFSGCPRFAKKLVLTKRIKWFEDSKGQPSFNHAWFIWDWHHSGPPTLAYGPA